MKPALQALSRVDVAVSCAIEDGEHRGLHLRAALSAATDLQRAIRTEIGKEVITMKKKPVKKPGKPPRC